MNRRIRWKARKTLRFGPLVIHLTQRGYSSWGLRIGRWTWNAKTRRHTLNTPGPGSLHWGGKHRRPPGTGGAR